MLYERKISVMHHKKSMSYVIIIIKKKKGDGFLTVLYKGIFWLRDLQMPSNGAIVCKVRCDKNGHPINKPTILFNSKDGKSYNHQLTWQFMKGDRIYKRSWNYYPRGRVEVKSREVKIFITADAATERVKDWVIQTFCLGSEFPSKIKFIADGSRHYRYAMDAVWDNKEAFDED